MPHTDEQWLQMTYGMYVESYDYDADATPPLTYADWKNAYADVVLRERDALNLDPAKED